MRWPLSTPAGIRTFTGRSRRCTPVPKHVGQGSTIFVPRPPHSGQGEESEKSPWLSFRCPVPPQRGQTTGDVPGLEPDPPHVAQGTVVATWTVVTTPST